MSWVTKQLDCRANGLQRLVLVERSNISSITSKAATKHNIAGQQTSQTAVFHF